MTHSLHRRGSIEDLREDFVLLVIPPRDENSQESEETQEKMRQVWEVISHYEKHLTSYGNGIRLVPMDVLKSNKAKTIAHAVFKDRETLKTCIRELRDRQFGISVVISGLYEEVNKICSELGFSPHTVEHSLGVHGKTERLPGKDVLEITTMCGHHTVSPYLAMHLAERITKGKMTYEKAAKELSKMCTCGIFNPHRAENILRKLTSKA
jgi:hypothetical protein